MAIKKNTKTVIERVVGNRETIGATLKKLDGTVVDLTGKKFRWELIDTEDDSVKVSTTNATIESATDGQVGYTPVAADVDTAGLYAMYFIDATTTIEVRYPYDRAQFLLDIKGAGQP